jgi:hypothetical protein
MTKAMYSMRFYTQMRTMRSSRYIEGSHHGSSGTYLWPREVTHLRHVLVHLKDTLEGVHEAIEPEPP